MQVYFPLLCLPQCSTGKWVSSPHTLSIDILDDDSPLNIFYLHRPFLFGEDEDDDMRLFGGREGWGRGHWWVKLSHICQRWRNVILESSSYLGLFLTCTKGTPVADMLAHSPPLQLVIDYYEDFNMSAEDEGRLILALEKRDRIRRIRLRADIPNLQRLIKIISDEYPILEYLIIAAPRRSPSLTLPERLHAPHLHHLVLSGFVLPIESRLLTTAVNLVTLVLRTTMPPTYFHPNALLHWISFMPRLETLIIHFHSADPSRTIERQLTYIPTTLIALPHLRRLWFQGVDALLEAVVPWIVTPRLERLRVFFFDQLTFSVPRLMQFLSTAENLRFNNARLIFSTDRVDMGMYAHQETCLTQCLHIRVLSWSLELQVSAVAQIFNSLSQIFSALEHLTFSYKARDLSSEEHDEVDRTECRRILRSFSNVETLRIEDGLDEEIARCLRLEDGQLPLDLLPELHELTYSRNSDTDNKFASFINARQKAGYSITLLDL